MTDKINPAHYQKGGIETIDYLRAVLAKDFDAYAVGNIIKYVSRWKDKNGVEDLKKAQWYLNDLIKWVDNLPKT
jgi:hypothetical protein